MSTNTSKTGTTSQAATSTSSTVRRGSRVGEHVVSLQFGAWGPQEVIVRAYSDGGVGERPASSSGSGRA